MNRYKLILPLSVFLMMAACESTRESTASEFKVNGLSIILKEIHQSDIVSVGFYLKGGVAYTPQKQAGIEQLLLSVMPKGSDKYDKEALQGLSEAMGTEISGRAGEDYSSLSLRCLSGKFDESWDIFQDVILHPRLDSTEIELARVNQLTNIRSEKDNPDSYLNKLAREFYYGGHPYATSPMGNEYTVSGFPRDELVNYHQNHVTKERSLLVIVGGIKKQDVLGLAKKLAKGLPKGESYSDRLPTEWAKYSSGMRVIENEEKMPTNYLIGQAQAPDKISEDYFAFLLASQKLQTRVFEEVRTKRNLSYAPAAGFRTGKSSTTYLYVTTTQPDTTIKVMFAELDRLKEVPLTEKELKELRMMFLTRHYMSKETASAQLDVLANYELTGKGYRHADNFMEKIQAVTAEDIKRVARKYLKNYQFTYLGDPESVNEDVFLSYSWPADKAEK